MKLTIAAAQPYPFSSCSLHVPASQSKCLLPEGTHSVGLGARENLDIDLCYADSAW